MTPRRVVVVDDSATMRALIREALAGHPGLQVVGEAGDPLEARQAIRDLAPDVITLDVEMPNMNGLEFLDRLMRLRPLPVVMVSTLTQKGAEASLAALELGAVDCFGKPAGGGGFEGLAQVVADAAEANVAAREPRCWAPLCRPEPRRSADAPKREPYRPGDRIVAIGSSTGGVEALTAVIGGFPAACPPTVITQHMPASFTASFAARLDRTAACAVAEAQDGDVLEPGKVFIAPGGARHMTVRRLGERLAVRLEDGDPVSGHRPSVDVLFRSVAQAAEARAVGVILTGMGRDGADGLLAMRLAGATTIGQDEATSIVFGMPRAAAEIGAVERQLPLNRVGPALLRAAAARLEGTV